MAKEEVIVFSLAYCYIDDPISFNNNRITEFKGFNKTRTNSIVYIKISKNFFMPDDVIKHHKEHQGQQEVTIQNIRSSRDPAKALSEKLVFEEQLIEKRMGSNACSSQRVYSFGTFRFR